MTRSSPIIMKRSIAKKDFHVYLLVDSVYGVFYVGSGSTARLRSTIEEARVTGPDAITNEKCKRIREIWDEGREIKQKVVLSSNSRDEVRAYESFLIRHHGLSLTNFQGIHSKFPQHTPYKYELEDEQEVLNALQDPNQLESAIQSAKELVKILERFRNKIDPPTELSDLMRGALGASGWIEKNLGRSCLNSYLDDMARGFIAVASSLPQSDRLPEDILEKFHADGIKWLHVEDVLMIMIRLTRAGYLKRKKS